MEKRIILRWALVVTVLLGVTVASATDSTWTRSSASGAGDWDSSANWDVSGVPTATTDDTYTADANNLAEIQVTDSQTFGNRLFHGTYTAGIESAVLRIQNGGSLSYGTDVANNDHCYVGQTNTAEMVIESGGTFTHKAKLYLGYSSGSVGTVDVSGTLDLTAETHGMLVLGYNGTGTVNVLDGGIVKVHTFMDTYRGIDQPIATDGTLNIEGTGKVVVDGNDISNANTFITNESDHIYGNGVAGNVVVTYDAVEDETTITAIPVDCIWTRAAASGAGNWNSSSNWDASGVPTATTEDTYTADANNLAEIQVTDAQTFGNRLFHGTYTAGIESAVLRIQNGGSLSYGTDVGNADHCYIGQTNTAEMVIESGGTFTHKAKLYAGYSSGSVGTVDVSGTLDLTAETHGMLVLGYNGTGIVNVLDGGIVKVHTFMDTYRGIDQPIATGGTLNIEGTGKVVVDGNDISNANTFITNESDHIYGNGVAGNVVATYDSGQDETTITALPVTYVLTVNNGTGDGNYAEDSVNNIVADAPAAGYVFDVWTGDTAYVANVSSASTTVTMPAAAVSVTATYKTTDNTWVRPIVQGFGDWGEPNNWDAAGVPGAATDDTYTATAFDLADIEVTDAQTFGNRLIHGSFSPGTESAILHIMSGGSLSYGTDVGNDQHCYIGKSCTSKMIIGAGGTFTHKAKLYVGYSSGSVGTVDVSGTLDLTAETHGMLVLGYNGTGTVNVLDGGIVKVHTFMDTYRGIDQPIAAGGTLNIEGTGKVVVDGNDISNANTFITNESDHIYGNGVAGNVVATYDSGQDETTITAVSVQVVSTWTRSSASGAGNWNSSSNWDGGEIPTATTDDTYTADANNLAEIQVSDTQTFGNRLFHGSNALGMTSPILRIQSGGSLSMGTDVANDQHSYIGYTNSAEMIVEAGGTFTTGRKLYLGKNDGVIGVVDVAGTFDISDANGLLVLGSAGTGFIDVLNGGVLKVHTFADGSSGIEQPIKDGSVLNVIGTGEIVADGNSLSAAEALIAGGRIAGDGVLGNVEATYDSGQDETVITVIAEPQTYSVWTRSSSSGAGNWNVTGNWDAGGVPSVTTDDTYTADADNLAEIQVTDSETFGNRLFHGTYTAGTESAVLRIQNGGSLSYGTDVGNDQHCFVGQTNTAEMVIESGGTFTHKAKLYVGYSSGSVGTVDVSGTLDLAPETHGKLVLGYNGTGTLNILDGGVVKVHTFMDTYRGIEQPISSAGTLNIEGTGKLVVDGNDLSNANTFITNESDHLYGNGIAGNVVATYDAGQDETTITVYSKMTLVTDGDPNVVIVIGTDATETEEYAADELQTYLEKISGATVSIVTESGTIANAIVIGTPDTCDYVYNSGLVTASSLGRDGFIIKTVDDANDVLVLAGENPPGALYGTYAFLEEHLGCRWYFPGDDGEYVPSTTTIEIGQINDTQIPAMPFRGIHPVAKDVDNTITPIWMARNRMNLISQTAFYWYQMGRVEDNVTKGIVHSTATHFSHWLGGSDLFDTHPEYFPLLDGERVEGFPSGYDPNVLQQHNYCLSNLDLVDEVADAIEDYVALYPGVEVIGVNQQDSQSWCECAPCTALGTPTDRLHTFLNRLVAELDSRGSVLDNRVIGTQAYQLTSELPVNVEPNEKVVVYYCIIDHCARHGWDEECPKQEAQKDMLAGWLEHGNKVIAYTYHAEHCTGFPFAMAYHSSSAIKYYDQIGVSGWYPETVTDNPGEWPLNRDPNLLWGDQWYSQKDLYYTAAKTLWNPDITVDEIKDDFFPKFYGAAGPAMRNYYEVLEEAWHYPGDVLYPDKRLYNYNPSTCIDFLTPALINTMKGYLDDAVDSYDAEPQVIKDRVDRDVELFAKWELRYEETGGIPTVR